LPGRFFSVLIFKFHYLSLIQELIVKNLLLILIASLPLSMCAQLSNGSFEVISSMPNGLGQWQRATGWSNAGSNESTPDLLHYDAISSCDLPETSMGLVQSFDGDAVMGLAICGRPSTNVREYISTRLAEPLVAGKPYAIGFRMTNGSHLPTSQAGLAVNGIGVHFGMSPLVQQGTNPIIAEPQLKIESTVYSSEWQTFLFTFYPQESYEYLTFGLFGEDADKSIQIFRGANPSVAYYFLDYFTIEPLLPNGEVIEEEIDSSKVVVEPTLSDSQFFIPNTFTPNGDGNNDRFIPVSMIEKEWLVEIFSQWGTRVYASNQLTNGWDGSFEGLPCSPGGYVWQITYWTELANGKKQRNEKRGMFHLVR
jgi:gliding motility-associated-like protein